MIRKFIKSNFPEILLIIIVFYLAGSFIPPVAYKNGNPELAERVHSVYRFFCHQRVERSPFLLGEKEEIAFYSVPYLQSEEAIPYYNPYVPDRFSTSLFGYKYYGNPEVGYKTALCIRDIALYVGMITGGGYYLVRYRKNRPVKKFNWKLSVALMIPMVLDVLVQMVAEIFSLGFITDSYVDDIPKRVITGILFGVGFALLIFPNLKESIEQDYN